MSEQSQGATARPVTIEATEVGGGRWAIIPRSYDQAWTLAQLFAASGEMVPKCYRERPESACMAILWGMELGISPIQAIQGIAVIGGRAGVWGDLMLALVVVHPDFEGLEETPLLGADGAVIGYSATCRRKGRAVTREFTLEMAAKAGLLGKDSPWKTYTDRMCMMRARSWAVRDCMPDALRGLASADEMQEVEMRDVTPVREPIREPQEVAQPEAVAAIEHQANPLDDLAGIDLGSLQVDVAEVASIVNAATAPIDHSALSLDLGDTDGEPEPQPARPPLTTVAARELAKWQAQAMAKGVSEQDLIDQLGDYPHGGNVAKAIAWLKERVGSE